MSSAALVTRLPDPSSSFREDAPRPPVPGEEGETPPCQAGLGKGQVTKPMPVSSNTRRNEDGLGEPEGRASPDSPLTRWTKSLHSLLGDQDGAYLFRTFLEREKCVDTLDFWFACNGFRQMNLKDTKTLRVAKAIYKRYIENNSIVSKQLKPATKTYIRDGIKKQQIDSIMFDQAQTEIQSVMEENAYQMFLTSDIYLEYVRSGGENTAYMSSGGLGSLKVVCGYLPTLNEEEEWTCADFKCKLSPTVVGLSSKTLRATANVRSTEAVENGYRSFKRSDSVNPYHVGSGYVFAPATSANDSEISSDALTDDSMSMTDSSVDGIPPYRVGSKKQLQREMHRSVKANGQVSLPHFPRTHRLPKEMTPVEPAIFAAELISRLEKLKLELESRHSLEERLQQIREVVLGRHLHPWAGAREESIHLRTGHRQRGAVVPSCSPVTSSPSRMREGGYYCYASARATPRCRSRCRGSHLGECWQILLPQFGLLPASALGRSEMGSVVTHLASRREAEGRWEGGWAAGASCHHPHRASHLRSCKNGVSGLVWFLVPYSSSRGSTLPKRSGKGTEPGLALPIREGGAPGGAGAPQLPGEEGDRSQDVWQWMLESERQSKAKPHSAQSTKKAYSGESARVASSERAGRHHLWGASNGHPRTVPRAHPFTQDPAMPPLTPPNTLAQLEEACRRLAEVSKPSKQRCCVASQQRDRNHPAPGQAGTTPFSTPALAPEDHKEPKKLAGVHPLQASELVVTYFFCGEEIPYRRMLKAQSLTLGHFKEQLSKKGNYRYYFKKASDEFACGAVFEEIWDDDTMLPMYEGRILGKVERID
uniref:Axin 2 n=1 Tax=Loxodonta africana TaxID=9785 RepID=G3TYF0_LOXAF